MGEVRIDRGQAVPLVLGTVAVAGAVLVALAHLAAGALDAARARSAADATALAVAADGPARGQLVAGANHAEIISIARDGERVLVSVRVGRARATARAETYLTDG